MRKLIVSCNVTVDGFMSGPGGTQESLQFIANEPELEDDLAAMFSSSVETIVVGRKTYSAMAGYWKTAPGEMADWLNATPKVVLSRDADADLSAWDNATLAAGDPVDQVRRLKGDQGAAMVAFGGVQTLHALVAAGLVDEFWLKVSPVALGQGESMFADLGTAQSLSLSHAQTYPNGSIHATYIAD